MITKLTLQNFQSHKETILEFSPGVNIIVGFTDSGKSAIIRALRWLYKNRPTGDEFRSNWGGDTIVKAEMDDCVVSREKIKNDNFYRLNDSSFTAFGTEVPDEIRTALNLDEANFQGQLDSHFLLSNSPGEVAAHFNKIAQLDSIDRARKTIQAAVTRLNGEIKNHETSEKTLETQLEGYDYLEAFETHVEVIEHMEDNRRNLLSKITRLTALIKEGETLEAEQANFEGLISMEKYVENVLANYRDKSAVELKKSGLMAIVQQLLNLRAQIKDKTDIMEDGGLVADVLGLYAQRKTLDARAAALCTLVVAYEGVGADVLRAEKKAAALLTKFNDAFPEACPLCDNPFKHDHDEIP